MKKTMLAIVSMLAMCVTSFAMADNYVGNGYQNTAPIYDTIFLTADTADPAMPGSVITGSDIAAVEPRIWLLGSGAYVYLDTASEFNSVACSMYIEPIKATINRIPIAV